MLDMRNELKDVGNVEDFDRASNTCRRSGSTLMKSDHWQAASLLVAVNVWTILGQSVTFSNVKAIFSYSSGTVCTLHKRMLLKLERTRRTKINAEQKPWK